MEAGQRTRTINTRGVANGRATVGAVALFAILMAGSGIANAQTVIWEATVTVEELGNRKGYSALAEIGSLSNTTFSYKGRSLTVNGVQVSVIEGTTELFFEIDDLFAEEPSLSNWTLTINGSDFTEATATVSTLLNLYKWSTYPTWSHGDMVTVRLTTTEPGAPRNVTATDNDTNGPTMTLAWAAPSSVGSTAITGYQYRRGQGIYGVLGECTTIPNSANATSTAVKMPYAWPDGTYLFEMRAVTTSTEGLWSTVSEGEMVDEREGLQVSDTSAYEGYEDTAGQQRCTSSSRSKSA